MELNEETKKAIQDACREVVSELRSPQPEEQMNGETLGDNLANMVAAAREYANAMEALTSDTFGSSAGDAAQALAEQLRAIVKMARRA